MATETLKRHKEDRHRPIGDKLKSVLPFIVGVTVVLSFVAVVVSLIVNPKSLDSKTNMTIGMIVGTVNTLMSLIAGYYFTRVNQSAEKSETTL